MQRPQALFLTNTAHPAQGGRCYYPHPRQGRPPGGGHPEGQAPGIIVYDLENCKCALGCLPPDESALQHADYLAQDGEVEGNVDGAVGGDVRTVDQERC